MEDCSIEHGGVNMLEMPAFYHLPNSLNHLHIMRHIMKRCHVTFKSHSCALFQLE